MHAYVQNQIETYHIELGNGGPLREFLDTTSDSFVGENIDSVEINVVGLEDLARGVAESTLGEELASLHEEQDGVVVNQILDSFLRVLGGFLGLEGHESSFGCRNSRSHTLGNAVAGGKGGSHLGDHGAGHDGGEDSGTVLHHLVAVVV